MIYLLILIVLVPIVVLIAAISLNRVPVFAEPGVFARLATYLTRNVAETSDTPLFPELATPVFGLNKDDLVEKIKLVCNEYDWEVRSIADDHSEVHIIVSSPLWKFQDDMVVKLIPLSENETSLSIRSASRVGKGDLGANTKHILDLVQNLRSLVQR